MLKDLVYVLRKLIKMSLTMIYNQISSQSAQILPLEYYRTDLSE